MADMHFEEHCPCGNNIKVSGYESQVKPQIQTWQKVHDKHANAIAKAIAENTKWPIYYVPPQQPIPWWQQGSTFTFESTLSAEVPKS